MSSKLLAPVYLILGGAQPNEGCVITRTRTKALDVWQLGSEASHAWYLLQTNNDHWHKPPFFDDRVHPGEFCMNQLGQQVSCYFSDASFDPLHSLYEYIRAVLL